jgi:hypothetical protein
MTLVREQSKFQKWKEERSTTETEIDFVEGMKNRHVREKFRRFVEKNYVIESFFFYIDVSDFKATIPQMTPAERLSKAWDIFKIYIQDGALLQINISSRMRDSIKDDIEDAIPTERITRVGIQVGETTARKVSVRIADKLKRSQNADASGTSAKASTGDVRRRRSSTPGLTMSSGSDQDSKLARCFDPAIDEIVNLMNTGAWKSFVEEGGMYRIHINETQEE